jgi:hypothetical protein
VKHAQPVTGSNCHHTTVSSLTVPALLLCMGVLFGVWDYAALVPLAWILGSE